MSASHAASAPGGDTRARCRGQPCGVPREL